VAVDSGGVLYIGDRGNQRVRRVDTDGIITTLAGTGTPGFSGDGERATDAQLREPYGLAVDNSGALYIADWGNHRVRRVDTDGQ
jgi:sugar lactone lactonase YvrE